MAETKSIINQNLDVDCVLGVLKRIEANGQKPSFSHSMWRHEKSLRMEPLKFWMQNATLQMKVGAAPNGPWKQCNALQACWARNAQTILPVIANENDTAFYTNTSKEPETRLS